MGEMKKQAMETGDSVGDLLRDIYRQLASVKDDTERAKQRERIENMLADYAGEDRVISSDEARQKILEEGEDEYKLFTGMPMLDKTLDGLRPGNLAVVSAPTGAGKTTLCQQLTTEFLKNNMRSVWFSYEVPMREFLTKMPKETIFYLPSYLKGNTTEWLEKRVIEARAKYDVKTVFIDHLHYIVDLMMLGKGVNTSLVIGQTVRALKLMALRWNVVVVLIAHLRKTRFDEMPELSDLRDSSFVAQEADVVLIMKRLTQKTNHGTQKFTNEAVVTVQKNRRTGAMCSFKVSFWDGRFSEIDERHADTPGY